MPVEELLARISSRELTEWMAFARLEPFGEWRDDLRTGIVASTLANIHAGKNRKFEPQDFMPEFDEHKEQQDPDEMLNIMRAMFGG